MEIKILTKEYVLNNGIDFDDDILEQEYLSDRILDNSKESGGKPFTGLTYETYPNGNLAYYCYYKNGFSDGDFIEFYDDGKIKSMQYMQRGRTYGFRKIWHNNGVLKSKARYEYGVCLTSKEWNEEGVLVKEKSEPTEDDIKIRNSQEKWYKKAIEKE
ncbi:toxin-antitoxin system YwqK family antitoxin [Clostridium sp. ZS2-4]|uniref:toxin-antitoxin system YwqK family antitoxin n=1 Tax=Clostridium sp. ZS2-4 TaxID=2987703 RepID=UPI00227BA346|nr:hypothetical protein [Clostridium sp. ZS2-4]MCY6354521.1 hypothetical protein [Clostridium sp. ZS2-4]